MKRTTLELDERKVELAAAALGTRTVRETVDRCLDEVIAQAARERLIERLSEATDLADPAVMQQAWRD
jgi:hypothetical protein